jgi:hypothetical protein
VSRRKRRVEEEGAAEAAGGARRGGRGGARGAGPEAQGGRGRRRTARREAAGLAPADARDAPGRSARRRVSASGWGLGVQIAFLVAVFAVVTLIAELAGAANLGVALGVGQIAFAIGVVYLLLTR